MDFPNTWYAAAHGIPRWTYRADARLLADLPPAAYRENTISRPSAQCEGTHGVEYEVIV